MGVWNYNKKVKAKKSNLYIKYRIKPLKDNILAMCLCIKITVIKNNAAQSQTDLEQLLLESLVDISVGQGKGWTLNTHS